MKQLIVLAIIVTFALIAAPAQTRAVRGASPKEVVEQFWTMETAAIRYATEMRRQVARPGDLE